MRRIITVFLASISFLSFSQVQKVGQGVIPEDQAFGFTMAPDKQTAYFVRSFSGRDTLLIYEMVKKEGRWQKPVPAEFTSLPGVWKDIDPFITPDGKQLFFQSTRPLKAGGPANDDFDIWVLDKKEKGWSKPRHLGFIVNSDTSDSFLSATATGKLYFGSMRKGTLGGIDIFSAEYKNNKWQEPVNVGPVINSVEHNTNPFISPDESFMIMSLRSDREKKDSELHISFNQNGKWTAPWNLGREINSEISEFCPFMVPGEDTLYFARLDKGVRFKENIFKTHFSVGRLKKMVQYQTELVDAIPSNFIQDNSWISRDGSCKIFSADTSIGFGGLDLYISYKTNGEWSPPVNLGPVVNSDIDDHQPGFSENGKYFFFKRKDDFYRIDAAAVPTTR